MKKTLIYALLIIGLCALVLLMNVGTFDRISLNLLVTSVSAPKSIVLLGAISIGVLIGVLLK